MSLSNSEDLLVHNLLCKFWGRHGRDKNWSLKYLVSVTRDSPAPFEDEDEEEDRGSITRGHGLAVSLLQVFPGTRQERGANL